MRTLFTFLLLLFTFLRLVAHCAALAAATAITTAFMLNLTVNKVSSNPYYGNADYYYYRDINRSHLRLPPLEDRNYIEFT